jgi:hypothetical protein
MLAQTVPQNTGICELTSSPAKYSGMTVTVWASVVKEYHGTFLVDHRCRKSIPLVIPEGSAMAPRVELKRDEAYAQFDKALHDYRPGTARLIRRRIKARFTGRFEYLPTLRSGDSEPKAPLGAQWLLVLESVSSVRLR